MKKSQRLYGDSIMVLLEKGHLLIKFINAILKYKKQLIQG